MSVKGSLFNSEIVDPDFTGCLIRAYGSFSKQFTFTLFLIISVVVSRVNKQFIVSDRIYSLFYGKPSKMAEANPTNLSDGDPTAMCDHCPFRGISTQAGTYCLVCSEYLCDSCEAVHRSSKASRDHELKPFEDSQRLSIKRKALISSIMECDIHRTETLTLFCVNHNIAVCDVCNSMKHRKFNIQALKQISIDANQKNDVF